jgi:hypothetical protein
MSALVGYLVGGANLGIIQKSTLVLGIGHGGFWVML